jgi:hypothetical protein
MSIYTKPYTKPLTPKQNKVISQVLEDMGKVGYTKKLREIMKNAGYSKAIQKNPQLIMNSPRIKEHLKPFIKRIEEKKSMALNELTQEKVRKAGARDIAGVVDILVKNEQLLKGGATARVIISPQEKQEVDDAFALNS